MALPGTKSNYYTRPAGIPASQWCTAEEFNALVSAVATHGTNYALLSARTSGEVNVLEFGAKGDGTTDDAGPIQDAIDSLGTAGGTVRIPVGTFIIGDTLLIPAGVHLRGSGMRETVLKMKLATNKDMIRSAGSLDPREPGVLGCSIRDLEMHGNQYGNGTHLPDNPTGNTAGGAIYWNSGSTGYGPALTVENVYITQFSGGEFNAAVHTIGSIFYVFKNVQIVENPWATGIYHKGSDSFFDGVYASRNGTWQGYSRYNVVVQGGADNRFIGCYFGGGLTPAQVWVYGGIINQFIGCTNDNVGGHGYLFSDYTDPATLDVTNSTGNLIVGGTVTNANQYGDGSEGYDHIHFEGGANSNRVIGTYFDNGFTNKGTYAIREVDTAGGNIVIGCRFGTFRTGVASLRSGGGTLVSQCSGYSMPAADGFTVATGSALKGAFAADTATLVQTAQRVKAIEDALMAQGLLTP